MAPISVRVKITGAALSVLVLALVGCSSGSGGAGGADGRVRVVASTNVWGSVAQAVGGDAVRVDTLVDDPAADPHSYESTPTDAADIADADLVVFNGGGYDEFMTQILETAGGDKPTVETFALLAEQRAEPNEHVWYDLQTVRAVAGTIAERLAALRPEQAPTFTANADAFGRRLDELSGRLTELGQRSPGAPVALTEPLAVYLLEDAGLRDVTPPEFIEAVEEETDPPALAVDTTRQLVAGRRVAALIYNPQTETPVTQQIRTAADESGVPVVEMTETLPPGTDYLTWMGDQVQALTTALPAR